MSADDVLREVAFQQLDISWVRAAATDAIHEITREMCRPSVLYRPRISIDGNMWCVIYGVNLQDGVAGFGCSPEEAMQDFDAAWAKKL